MKFSKLAFSLTSSSTMAATLKAQELKSQGKAMVIATVGEPDADVDIKIKEALFHQLKSEPSRYASAQGLHSTRKVLSSWFQNLYGLSYSPQQIAVTPGSKFGLYALMQLLCETSDEVLIPAPYWVSYVTQAKMAGATPKICQPDENYKLTPQTLLKTLTENSRILILNSPNNPSGAVYKKSELRELYLVLKDYPQVTVICDDIYNQLIFSNEKRAPSLLDVVDKEFQQKRIILVHGVSKSYAMTGWRMGWVAAETECIEKLTAFLSQTLTCIPDFIQKAAETALTEGDQFVHNLRAEIKNRHLYILNELKSLNEITVYRSEGAFYIWLRLHDKSLTSERVAEKLLNEKGLAVVPGEAFGMPYHLRLSVTMSEADLKNSILLLKEFFSKKN